MADIADIAQEQMEANEAVVLGAIRSRSNALEVLPTGKCLYCDEPTDHRWCNTECRDEWEHLKGKQGALVSSEAPSQMRMRHSTRTDGELGT